MWNRIFPIEITQLPPHTVPNRISSQSKPHKYLHRNPNDAQGKKKSSSFSVTLHLCPVFERRCFRKHCQDTTPISIAPLFGDPPVRRSRGAVKNRNPEFRETEAVNFRRTVDEVRPTRAHHHPHETATPCARSGPDAFMDRIQSGQKSTGPPSARLASRIPAGFFIGMTDDDRPEYFGSNPFPRPSQQLGTRPHDQGASQRSNQTRRASVFRTSRIRTDSTSRRSRPRHIQCGTPGTVYV